MSFWLIYLLIRETLNLDIHYYSKAKNYICFLLWHPILYRVWSNFILPSIGMGWDRFFSHQNLNRAPLDRKISALVEHNNEIVDKWYKIISSAAKLNLYTDFICSIWWFRLFLQNFISYTIGSKVKSDIWYIYFTTNIMHSLLTPSVFLVKTSFKTGVILAINQWYKLQCTSVPTP